MTQDDIDIGRVLQPGERSVMSGPQMSMLIDAAAPHELILLARGEERSDIVNAGDQAPYSVERYEDGRRVTIRFDRMSPDHRYVLGAYVTSGRMPSILATMDEPRMHFPIQGDREGAVAIFEFYYKDGWRMKSYGGWYSGGLQAMISA